MVVIDDALVDSAIAIKNKFESLRLELSNYEKYVIDLGAYLLEMSNDLEKYAKNDIHNASSVTESTQHVLKIMMDMEAESDRVSNLIDPINTSIESLKKDEINLYNEIKKRNPNVSDSDIIRTLNEKMLKSDT